MSKVESPPPKQLPKAPLKAVPDPLPLPPLFWSSGDETPKNLKAPIYLVWVSTKDKAGEDVPLDCTPLGGLPEFPHQLAEKYPGVPFIELVARSAEGTIVARVVHRCRAPAAAAAAAPAGAAPAASGGFDAMAVVNAVNERTDRLMGLLITSKDAAAAQIIDVIGKMSGARIQDAQAAAQNALHSKGGAPAQGELATFLKGIDWAQKMMAAGVEEGDGDGLEDLFRVAAEEFMRAKGAAAGAAAGTTSGAPRRPTRTTEGEEVQ